LLAGGGMFDQHLDCMHCVQHAVFLVANCPAIMFAFAGGAAASRKDLMCALTC
jgi:preprotein translocase subunit SecB